MIVTYWIDKEAESDNVVVTSDSTIFIGSCDKDAYSKVNEQLVNKKNPIEVFGTEDLTVIPFNQIQKMVSRSTDRNVDISYKAKKEIEEETIYFSSLEEKQDFVEIAGQHMPEQLVKSEAQQSIATAISSPLISLALSLVSTYMFINKLRWVAIIVGGLWVLASLYMLFSRMKEPPMITRWSIRGRYFRKTWNGIKTAFSYAFAILVILAIYGKFPDAYGPKSIYEQIQDDSLNPSEVKTLLNRGANINYKGSDDDTALATALDWGSDELAITLIESGADLSIKSNSETPLKYAIYNDTNIDVIESMLKNGASLKFDIEGMTPLEYSKQYENIALEQLITKYASN